MYFIFGKFGNRVSRYYVIPKKLVDNRRSRYLQGLSESAEISVDYVCSEAECRHILQAIVQNKSLSPYFFVPFARLCQVLTVDSDFLTQLIPLYQVSCRNMPYVRPLLFTLWRSIYRSLVQDLCLRCLGKRLTYEQTKDYSVFKKTIRDLCGWKIRNSHELWNGQ